MWWDYCEEALAIALLEENIERLSCSITHGWSAVTNDQAVTDIRAVIDAQIATGGPGQLAARSRSPQPHPAVGTL